MDLNKCKRSITLTEFFNKYYINYMLYRVMQRLPSIIDGCISTHRKIVYTCLDKNVVTKIKVADISSIVSLHTKYHHGVGSIESSIANMVPLFANNLPLLKEDGAYGSRSNRKASAPRYIETRMFPHTSILFNKLDNDNFTVSQFTENKKIEPKNLICALPLLIINGMEQIGVGYSCKILPRNPLVVINILKDLLTGKIKEIPKSIQVYHHNYKGTVVYDAKKNRWCYKGVIKLMPKNVVKILDVPFKYTSESYLKKLEALVLSGVLKKYDEDILGDKFEIAVQFNDNDKYLGKNFNEDKILDVLGLVSYQSETLTALDAKNAITSYDNIGQILYEYIVYMLGIYNKRKDLLLFNLDRALIRYTNRVKFISLINDGILVTKGKTKVQLEKELETHLFETIDDSYDYLIGMSIVSLTLDKIEELQIKIQNINLDIIRIQKETHASLWLADIVEIEKLLKKEFGWQ